MVWHVPVTERPPLPEKLTLSPSCLSVQALIASGGGPCVLLSRLFLLLFEQPVKASIETIMMGTIPFKNVFVFNVILLLFYW
jgi:hypothetical protein